MSLLKRLFPFALCLATLAPAAAQQQPAGRASQPGPKAPSAKAAAEADPEEELRRATAISLVNSLADEARTFRDATLRARVQARAADALWETEPERARALFRRAWDEAQAADDESERRMEEERQRQLKERGSFSMARSPSLRTEVLRLAAKRDHTLGEEFLALMDRARKQEEDDAARPSATDAPRPEAPGARRRDPVEATPANSKRLRLAVQLLEDGDVTRAVQFADPALTEVSGTALEFLTRLRARDAQGADARYTRMLARAAADPSSDANTASLLASYVFSPTTYVTFTHDGGASANTWGANFPPPADIPPLVRARLFETAAAILLRPLPPPDQDRTSSGRSGAYLVMGRLLPLFDQWAADKSPALRARQAALAPDTPGGGRESRDGMMTAGLVLDEESGESVADSLERLKRARTSEERDAAYVSAAFNAVRQKDPRAEEFISKIEDSEVRSRLRAYIDHQRAQDAVRAEDWQEVVRLARAGNLPPIQRAWALTEAARLAAKDDPGRGAELLGEALAEAKERIDPASPERASALVAIATQMLKLDRPRAWEVTLDAIKASNSAAGYTGEDGRLTARFQTKNMTMVTTSGAQSFDLAGVFAAFAREDLTRAIGLARNFEGEAPRAAATLALARAVLEKK